MSILKKLLSVVVVNAAVFMITLSFMAWVFDTAILNAPKLTASFDKNGVAKAIVTALPKIAAPEEEQQRGPDGQPLPVDSAKKAEVEDTIRKAVDEPYVRTKINGIVTNMIGFIKTGSPQPTIDLTDFPARIQSATGEMPEDLAKELSQPINLAEKTNPKAFESIHKSYDYVKIFKIVGPILALLLLVVEWFLTQKGKRLGKTAWVFLAAGAWGVFWWFLIARAPDFIITKVQADKGAEESMVAVVTALLKSLSTLLSVSFLQFGIGCLAIAGILLAIRFVAGRMKPGTTASNKPVGNSNAGVKAIQSAKIK